jgi:hypothetical protein
MRTVLAAIATAAIAAAAPAQAQAPTNMAAQRQPLPYPRMLHDSERYPEGFTQIPTADGEGRPLMIMVSKRLPENRQPYSAIVAWAGAPDHYWNMDFAFDCSSRSMARVDSVKRRWTSRYKANESFPVDDGFRGDFTSLVAPVICDGKAVPTDLGYERSLSAAQKFIDPAKR